MSRIKPPLVSRNVIVRTPQKIGGQNEHAAIVTRVRESDLVDVVVFPAGEDPYPIGSIRHADSPLANTITWRWPSGT